MRALNYIPIIAWLAFAIATAADAATITVGPGQTIASGIAAASTGDTVLVQASTRTENIVINKAITVKAEGLVTLRPSGRAIDVQCSNCTVDGFTFENSGQAASGGNVNRDRVTLKNLKYTSAGAGIWIWGTNWTIENVTLHCRMRGGEDNMDAFGSGHLIRRVFCYGVLPSDLLQSDGSYLHNDVVQSWTAGGAPGLKNSTIEECIFTDFAQSTYLHSESGVQDGINGITVRNNVFWGVDFPRAGGTWPSHGTRLTGPSSIPHVVKNNIYKHISNNLRLNNLGSAVTTEGNIIFDAGSVYSLVATTPNKGTLGNLVWSADNMTNVGAPDKTTINPQVLNPNAKGIEVLGPDGLMFTADDAWRPQNAQAALYGPQVGAAPPANTPPTVTLAGPSAPIQLASGQTSATVTITATGADAQGAVTYRWAHGPTTPAITSSQNPGVVPYTVTVTDTGGLTAAATLSVTVLAAPTPPPTGITAIEAKLIADASAKAAVDAYKATNDPRVTALESRKVWSETEIKAVVQTMRVVGSVVP